MFRLGVACAVLAVAHIAECTGVIGTAIRSDPGVHLGWLNPMTSISSQHAKSRVKHANGLDRRGARGITLVHGLRRRVRENARELRTSGPAEMGVSPDGYPLVWGKATVFAPLDLGPERLDCFLATPMASRRRK